VGRTQGQAVACKLRSGLVRIILRIERWKHCTAARDVAGWSEDFEAGTPAFCISASFHFKFIDFELFLVQT